MYRTNPRSHRTNAVFIPIALWLLCSLLMTSCYEKKSGCLDALASNFSIEADEDCCDGSPLVDDVCCCTYPDLVINTRHLHGEENLVLGAHYVNALGQLYIVEDIDFYLSDIEVYDGRWQTVNNQLDIANQATMGNKETDDVTVLSPVSFQFKIGDFTLPGNYDSLSMMIGLQDHLTEVDMASLPSGHPLDTAANALYDPESQEFLMFHIALITDTVSLDKRIYQVPAINPIHLSLPITAHKERGEDLTIPLSIDYRRWFDDVDLQNIDSILVSEEIRARISSSFSIIE